MGMIQFGGGALAGLVEMSGQPQPEHERAEAIRGREAARASMQRAFAAAKSVRHDARPPLKQNVQTAHSPRGASLHSTASGRGARRTPAGRDQERTELREQGAQPSWLVQSRDGQREQHQQQEHTASQGDEEEESGKNSATMAFEPVALSDLDFDLDELALDVAPLAGESGAFELMLPAGRSLSIVVERKTAGTEFMIVANDPTLTEHLRSHLSELQRHLEQRMGRATKITVL